MNTKEKPCTGWRPAQGTNRESSCPDTTPKTPINQLFESSRIRSAIDICADISSLTLMAYLLARLIAGGVQ